jgi:hypothetical protein
MAEQKERAAKSIFPWRVQRSYKPAVAPPRWLILSIQREVFTVFWDVYFLWCLCQGRIAGGLNISTRGDHKLCARPPGIMSEESVRRHVWCLIISSPHVDLLHYSLLTLSASVIIMPIQVSYRPIYHSFIQLSPSSLSLIGFLVDYNWLL